LVKLPKDILTIAIIGLGSSRRRSLQPHFETVKIFMNNQCEYRKMGASALTLAHTAEGRFDAFFEAHLNSRDALARQLICNETGAWTNPFSKNGSILHGNLMLACSKQLVKKIIELLSSLYPEMADQQWD
jgi:myo-inositol-1(or 4)-monophosphatase